MFLCLILLTALTGFAQKKKTVEPQKTLEQAIARSVEPEIKVFIRPKIAEIEMLSTEKMEYGPYKFALKDPENLSQYLIEQLKVIALFRATKEAGADILVGSLYDIYILDNDSKTLYIDLSGYPAKYVNFKNIEGEDVNMVNTVYPAASKSLEKAIKTQAFQGTAK